jgi:hypothetical protein
MILMMAVVYFVRYERSAQRDAQSLCAVRAPTVKADRRRDSPKF